MPAVGGRRGSMPQHTTYRGHLRQVDSPLGEIFSHGGYFITWSATGVGLHPALSLLRGSQANGVHDLCLQSQRRSSLASAFLGILRIGLWISLSSGWRR